MKPAPARTRMWQSMRCMHAGFSVSEIIATAEVAESTARRYVQLLLHAGYLRVTTFSAYRMLHNTRYLLIRNTGPRPPEPGSSARPLTDTEIAVLRRARRSAHV